MAKRGTKIGKGTFGQLIDPRKHAFEVLQRVLSRGYPLTEDAVVLSLLNILWQRDSRVYRNVRSSSVIGGQTRFNFSPDIDSLEVRKDGRSLDTN